MLTDNAFKYYVHTADQIAQNIRDYVYWTTPLENEVHSWITENKESNYYDVSIELPGYLKSEIEVKAENGVLDIAAKNAKRGAKACRHLLGEDIDTANISASLENGILTVILPKKKEKVARKIEVK